MAPKAAGAAGAGAPSQGTNAQPGSQQAVLECKECSAHLSASNPAVTCGGHFKMHRKKAEKAEAGVAAAFEAGDSFGANITADQGTKRQRANSSQPIYTFVATAAQAAS
jgi:hypothetical protein